MRAVDRVLERLDKVKKTPGGHMTRCPAHDDSTPSLSVTEGEDGRVLIHCHAGCSPEAVLGAVGLTPRDLFDTPNGNGNGVVRREVARHQYHDATGSHLFDIVRFNSGAKCQPFLPGARRAGIGETPRPLYRLPYVLGGVKAGETIYVCEGEKDADALHEAGVIATSNPFGAGPEKWLAEHTAALTGADVVVVQDRDGPGRERGQHLLRVLDGVAASVRLVEPLEGKDAHDHLAAGRSVADFVAAPPVGESALPAPEVARLKAIPLTDITMRSIEWLEKPIWQKSAFQLLAAPKGAGKGTYLAGLAARISRNGMNVVFISSEDSASIDTKPRLVAAGADIERCYTIGQHVNLPDDVDALRQLALDVGRVGLLVIDPVANHIGSSNSNSDAEVRNAIAPLNKLADDLGCLLIGVRHPGKDRSRGALASVLGSTAWVDTPRAVVMIATDDEDGDLRVIQVVAGNRARNGSAQAFRIDAVDVPGLSEPITVATALGESDKSVDSLLEIRNVPETKTGKARDLNLDLLEEEGDQESDSLDAHVAAELGLAARTIRNVRMKLSEEGLVKAIADKDEYGAVTRWRIGRTQAARR